MTVQVCNLYLRKFPVQSKLFYCIMWSRLTFCVFLLAQSLKKKINRAKVILDATTLLIHWFNI